MLDDPRTAWFGLRPLPVPPCPTAAELRRLGEEQWRVLQGLGAEVVLECDPRLPTAVSNLSDPPPLLSVIGHLDALLAPAGRVGVIGARACTPYGREQASRFGAGLAAAGVTVVSGAARGIDQAAMRGALEVGGRVVAVLGSGLGRPYPPDAVGLLRQIAAQGGAVVSEFHHDCAPTRGNFPRRNRILAAFCQLLMVVEATPQSGSFITVDHALDLSVDVFALPGSVRSAVSRGPHRLIQQGAALAQSPEDLLVALGRTPSAALGPRPQDHPVVAALEHGDADLEQLAQELGRNHDDLQVEIVELELSGLVLRLPGGFYHRCGPH